jgi:hypothetical protein
MPARRILRDVNEDARDIARALAKTEAFERSRRYRKSVEMLFAHLKRILRLGRLRLHGPCGAQHEFILAAIAQNVRRLAKLVARPPPAADPFWRSQASALCQCLSVIVLQSADGENRSENGGASFAALIADFCNNIGTGQTLPTSTSSRRKACARPIRPRPPATIPIVIA